MACRIEIVANADHQIRCGRALESGFRVHGLAAEIVPRLSAVSDKAEIVAVWGWRNGQILACRGKRVLLMERGYYGDRFSYFSLAWDGLNGRGRFPDIDDDGRRFRFMAPAMRTRRDPAAAGPVLILGQVPNDASLAGWPGVSWYERAAEAVREWGLEPIFRPHPLDPRAELYRSEARAFGMRVSRDSLEIALHDARAAVAWNSNSLTDAALSGLPVLAGDGGAMVWPIAGQGLTERPRLAERSGRWANRMGFAQWDAAEIASGSAWDALKTCQNPDAGHSFGSWTVAETSPYWPE